MFKGKKSNVGTTTTNTVIGQGVKLTGAMLTGNDSVRIDGEYVGEVDIDGSLILGETGRIKGDVSVNTALIAGTIEGNVRCSATLHIASSATLLGNIQSPALVVDEGAVFKGSCNMGSSPQKNTREEDVEEDDVEEEALEDEGIKEISNGLAV